MRCGEIEFRHTNIFQHTISSYYDTRNGNKYKFQNWFWCFKKVATFLISSEIFDMNGKREIFHVKFASSWCKKVLAIENWNCSDYLVSPHQYFISPHQCSNFATPMFFTMCAPAPLPSFPLWSTTQKVVGRPSNFLKLCFWTNLS